jgi:hypothetical protein
MDANGNKPNESLCFEKENHNPVTTQWETLVVNDVINLFNEFLNGYDYWRNCKGLSASIDDAYEITSSMADKLGRICRQVKHKERNDPKPDWPNGLAEDMAGLLVYMIILKNKYDVDIAKGMKIELNKSVEQHSK